MERHDPCRLVLLVVAFGLTSMLSKALVVKIPMRACTGTTVPLSSQNLMIEFARSVVIVLRREFDMQMPSACMESTRHYFPVVAYNFNARQITSGFSRSQIWRGMEPGLVQRSFTELYIIICDIDSAAAGTCSEVGDGFGDRTFIIPGPFNKVHFLKRQQHNWN